MTNRFRLGSTNSALATLFVTAVSCALAAIAMADEFAIFAGEADVPWKDANREAAKERATRLALAQALEAALPQTAPAEELEAKDAEIKKQILADPARYVVSFAVQAEETRGATLHVALEARVRLDALREAVRGIRVGPRKAGKKPTLALIPFHERPGGFAFAPEIERPLRERFEIANQPLAPAALAEELLGAPSFAKARRDRQYNDFARGAAAKGLQLAALIELTDQTPPDKQADSCDETAAVKILDAPAAAMLDSFAYKFPAAGSCAQVADAAGRELFAALMDSLARKGKLQESGAAAVTVEILGVADYDRLQQTQTLLRGLPYVKKVDLVSLAAGGRVRFAIVFAGPPAQLAEELAAAKTPGFALKPQGQTGNVWQYLLEAR
jgi:hypothetical protein